MSQELLIALIAAISALGGSLLGSYLTRTTEHKQWLRNERLKAYIRFLEVMQPFGADTLRSRRSRQIHMQTHHEYVKLSLIGTPPVRKAAKTTLTFMNGISHKRRLSRDDYRALARHLGELNRAIREDLNP
ncbi:hypothetical protein GCM10009784_08270 [Arthrobacter parietis]|uniref:Uncharacterized protein n=1 Tax=Arthrobacter parietis TaxID=271434 RepID=A0ABN3ARL9_9MICC